jgi:hypothetical protein
VFSNGFHSTFNLNVPYTLNFIGIEHKRGMSCPDCTTGGILPGEPTGTFSIKGAYCAAAPEATSKRAVLLLTDGFGLDLKNCKILADDMAKRLRCDVWVPDIFDGMLPFLWRSACLFLFLPLMQQESP